MRISMHEGIAGWIVKTGQPAIVEDVKKDDRFSDRLDKVSAFETRSIIGVPLKTKNKVIGVIELVNKLNGELFTSLELKILSIIADFAAIAIERAFYIRAIKRISKLDPLTGALNRRSLDSVLSRETERCKRHGTHLSVLMIDLDDFKKINDKYGHVAGDGVLKRCAEILERNVRKIDYVIRFGGDEFAVIMPDTGTEAAQVAKDRILEDLQQTNKTGADLPFRMSVGLHTSGADDVENILSATDEDLYRQKEKKEPVEIEEFILDFMDEEEKEHGSPK